MVHPFNRCSDLKRTWWWPEVLLRDSCLKCRWCSISALYWMPARAVCDVCDGCDVWNVHVPWFSWVQYAVRGNVLERSMELQRRMAAGEKLPFDAVRAKQFFATAVFMSPDVLVVPAAQEFMCNQVLIVGISSVIGAAAAAAIALHPNWYSTNNFISSFVVDVRNTKHIVDGSMTKNYTVLVAVFVLPTKQSLVALL